MPAKRPRRQFSRPTMNPQPSAPSDLQDAARRLRGTTLGELFARDPQRAENLSFEWNGWRADIAK